MRGIKRGVAASAAAVSIGVGVAPAAIAGANEWVNQPMCSPVENVGLPPDPGLHCDESFLGQMALSLEANKTAFLGTALGGFVVVYVLLGGEPRRKPEEI